MGEFATYKLRVRKRDTTREKKNRQSSWWFIGWHDRLKSYGTLRNPMKTIFCWKICWELDSTRGSGMRRKKMGHRAKNVFCSAMVIGSQSHTTIGRADHFQCRFQIPPKKNLLSTKSKGAGGVCKRGQNSKDILKLLTISQYIRTKWHQKYLQHNKFYP